MTESPSSTARPHVVIVGGGFGGLAAAKELNDAPVDVTLVDRTNHHLFQPLLYQVATAVLSPADISLPLRVILRKQKNIRVLMASVEKVETAEKRLRLSGARGELPYDYLILAPGARHAYFGNPEWEDHAPGLKSLEDARTVRHDFLLSFERAETETNEARRRALLTFVVVGAGPTGVEMAGMFATIARAMRERYWTGGPAPHPRVILLEGGPRVLPTFEEELAERAHRDLEALGVEVRTDAMVNHVEEGAVFVGEEKIETDTILWAAGNAASPLLQTLEAASDRAGRVLVDADTSVPGHSEVFVVGDAAAIPLQPGDAAAQTHESRSNDVDYVPGVAPAALQMGQHAARMIRASLRGEPRRPFRYHDKGSLAVIGRSRAVADLGFLKFGGWLGWMAWLVIHLMQLIGFRNRAVVLLSWIVAFYTYQPNAALVTESRSPRRGE